MPDAEQSRGVLPNGKLIDSLRKRKGWTIDDFAEGTKFSSRTAQKALAGRPVDMVTLKLIAERLDTTFDSLLLLPPDTTAMMETKSVHTSTSGMTLELHIKLQVSPDAPEPPAQLIVLLQLLKSMLPDNTSIGIIGIASGTAIFSVAMTPANVYALGSITAGLPDFDIEEVTSSTHYEIDGEVHSITDEELDGLWQKYRMLRPNTYAVPRRYYVNLGANVRDPTAKDRVLECCIPTR